MWVTPPNNNNNKKQVYLNLGLRTAALQWAHKFLDNTQCSEWRFNITFGMGFFFFSSPFFFFFFPPQLFFSSFFFFFFFFVYRFLTVIHTF